MVTVWVLFVMFYRGGTITYEFKDKVQCVSTFNNMKKHAKYASYVTGFCQEVRK